MRLLIVEDNLSLAEALQEALTTQLYVVDVVFDGQEGWTQAQIIDYDLIVLDLMLPKLDGINLCQRLRSHGYSMPILMITARDTSHDKVIGLDAGADDYVVKPIDLAEFLARVRALLRRGHNLGTSLLEWGDLKLDPNTYEVTYTAQPLHLTPKEFSLLECFLRNRQQVLSRSMLIEHIWSWKTPPSEDTVKAHIKSLRHKLRSVGAPPDLIETVYNVGYRLKQIP